MVYRGKLETDIYNLLIIDDSVLVSNIENDFKKGDKVFIRYFITDKEVNEEEAKEALITKTFGGNIDQLEYVLDAYSEYTILELKEDLNVDGHDLVRELSQYEGKYLTLIIEKV